jgi:hypothetical protein
MDQDQFSLLYVFGEKCGRNFIFLLSLAGGADKQKQDSGEIGIKLFQ